MHLSSTQFIRQAGDDTARKMGRLTREISKLATRVLGTGSARTIVGTASDGLVRRGLRPAYGFAPVFLRTVPSLLCSKKSPRTQNEVKATVELSFRIFRARDSDCRVVSLDCAPPARRHVVC